MSPRILDGKWLSRCYQDEIRVQVEKITASGKRAPGLGVILVGDNPASQVYVGNKEKLAKGCGLETFNKKLPNDATEEQLRLALEEFNLDERVDGILLQLPLPKHLNSNKFLDLIASGKDADGLTPLSQGLLLRGEGKLRPCTPQGSLRLIDLALSSVEPGSDTIGAVSRIPAADLKGMRAVVIGRSILVGKPVALLLLERGATVTIAHSKTADIAAVCREADIIVAAVGIPQLVKEDWIKPGAIVIDVGMNRLPNGKLVGDVDYENVAPRTKAITPVPGGVGPMTVVMLIFNTLQSYLGR